jgi:hypothetical protein
MDTELDITPCEGTKNPTGIIAKKAIIPLRSMSLYRMHPMEGMITVDESRFDDGPSVFENVFAHKFS